jgi:hypothetical protein
VECAGAMGQKSQEDWHNAFSKRNFSIVCNMIACVARQTIEVVSSNMTQGPDVHQISVTNIALDSISNQLIGSKAIICLLSAH